MRRLNAKERYLYNVRKQQATLEEFSAKEIEWANDLLLWYSIRNEEIPDDEYRACAFFINREFDYKPGSLTLLYEMYLRCLSEMPQITKENAFDILCYQFKMYAIALEKGNY